MKPEVIGVDFDGTCTTHEFPHIGKEIGAPKVLKRLINSGHKLVLFTMRSDIIEPTSDDPHIIPVGGKYLTDAVEWFKKHNIPLYGIQTNPTQKTWTHSPKAYANLYIDDAALGCPLKYEPSYSSRDFVDWDQVEKLLELKGYFINERNQETA